MPDLCSYDGGGRPVAPGSAYLAFGPELRLLAAVVDSVIWDDPGWADSMYEWLYGERPATTSTRTERLLAENGWRTVDDVYSAASLSKQQGLIFTLYCRNPTRPDYRSIAAEMSVTPLAARLQVCRAKEKLGRLGLQAA